MKFLVISDIHGNQDILDRMDAQFKEADGVLCAGDFSQFQHSDTGLPTLEKLCAKHDTIFAVIGNCDEPSLRTELEQRDVSVERTLTSYQGLAFAGSGGGSKFSGETPNERSDEDLASDLRIVTEQGEQEWNNLIVIIHNPPKDTTCDTIANGIHVGSPLLRTFIETYQPVAAITGHIHESAGIDSIGKTTVLNPGPMAEGRYAWLELSKQNGLWHVDAAHLAHL